MFITRVIARGFKRGSFDVTLDRANVITGDNFVGKTQILDAVRLGLIGYLPELGVLPRATFGLASGPNLEVQLHFDTGAVITREFWLEGNTVKQKHEIPASLQDCSLLAVMLNAEEYFALGPLDRTRYVAANCPMEILLDEDVTTRVKKVAPDYDLGAILDEVGKAIEERANKKLPAVSPQEAMEMTLKLVADHWKALGQTVQMHQGTINGLTTQRADEEAGIPLATLEEERATVARAIAEINERRGRQIGAFTQMKTDRHRREVINREIQQSEKSRVQLVGLKDRLALLDAEIAKFSRVTHEVITAASLKMQAAENGVAAINKAIVALIDAKAKGEATLAKLDEATTCPYCGAVGQGWKNIKTAEIAQAIASIESQDVEFTKGLRLAEAEAVMVKMHRDNLLTEQKRQNGIITDRDNTASEIQRLEPTLGRVQMLTEELTRLMADDPVLTAAVEGIQTELNIKEQEARGLDRLITAAAGRAHDLQRMATAEKERDAAAKLKEDAGTAGKELKAIQAEMVEGAFRPLLKTANAIFSGVLPFVLEYRDGEIGARAGGVWRGHKTMSGVEKALTYCAIQMALASRAPVKVAVLDEMTKLVSKRLPGFAARILASINSGLVDQVLVVDPERGDLYRGIKISADEDLAFNVIAVE